MNVWLVVLLDLALYLASWAAAEVTPPSTRTWTRYLALPLMPPFVRWRLEIIAKIRHWDRNILPVGRQTDVAMLLPIPRTQVVHTSQTQVEHKSYTSRTQVFDVVYNNVAYTMGSVLRPLLDVLQHVGFLLAQYDFDNMQCFRYSKPSRILVIKKQIDFKTSVTKIPLLPVLSAAVRKVWAGNRKFVSWASISQLDLNGFFAKRDGGKEAGSTHSMDMCLHYTNQCDRCDEAFSTVKNLKKHARTQHKCLRYTAWVNCYKTKHADH